MNKIVVAVLLFATLLFGYGLGYNSGYIKSKDEVTKLAKKQFLSSYLYAVREGVIAVNTNRLAELEAQTPDILP